MSKIFSDFLKKNQLIKSPLRIRKNKILNKLFLKVFTKEKIFEKLDERLTQLWFKPKICQK